MGSLERRVLSLKGTRQCGHLKKSIVIRKRALAHTDIQNKLLNDILQTRETYDYVMMRCNSYSKIKVE